MLICSGHAIEIIRERNPSEYLTLPWSNPVNRCDIHEQGKFERVQHIIYFCLKKNGKKMKLEALCGTERCSWTKIKGHC